MSPLGLGVAYGIGTFVLLFSGMPIAFALGGIALVFMLLFMPHLNLEIVPDIIYSELENITLLTIPLFILMGGAIGKSRAGADLYESLHRWLGRIPRGLGVANVLGCAIFAAMCGSSPATCSAIGSTGIPEMRKLGYSPGFAASIIAAGGTLGILLPPSVVLILYGVATQQSIGRLFMAGVGPGIMMTLMFVVYVMFQYRRDRNRVLASITAEGQRPPDHEEFTWAQRFETVPRMAPFVALILAIMFALYGGLATPSETAGVGAIGALLLVCIFYQSYRWSEMSKILRGSMREGCMMILIIGMSLLYSYVMSYLQITQSAATWLVSIDMSGVPVLGAGPGNRARLFPAAGGDHPDGRADYPARAEVPRVRSDLVRGDHVPDHGDRPDTPAGGPQPIRHQRDRTRHFDAGDPAGRAAVHYPDVRRGRHPVLYA